MKKGNTEEKRKELIMKKKLLSLTMAVVVSAATLLVGCGSSEKTVETKESKETTAEVTSEAVETTEVSEAAESTEAETAEVAETPDITIYGVNDPQISAALIMADKLGYFEEEGLNVTLQLFTGMDPIGAALSSGEAMIATTNNYEPILWVDKGAEIKVVAPLCNMAGTQAAALAPGVEISSAKDLENLAIGLQAGSPVTICFKNMCKELGVDYDSLNFVNLQPADQFSAMESGDIQVLSAWEPWITQTINAGGTFLLSGTEANFPEKQGEVDWFDLYNSLAVNDQFLAENPITIEKVLNALAKATDYINDNREDTVATLAVQFNLEEDILNDIMNRNSYNMLVDDTFISSTQYLEQYLYDEEFSTKKIETPEYIDFTILKEKLPERYTATTY